MNLLLIFTCILAPNLKTLLFFQCSWLTASAAGRLEPPSWALWWRCIFLQKLGFRMELLNFSEAVVSVTLLKGHHKLYPATEGT